MKVVIPGGSGQVGAVLRRAFRARGDEVVVLGRTAAALEPGVRVRERDARRPGPWWEEIDGADLVVNLAGRSVSCRPTDAHRREMMRSRVNSTLAIGEAIAHAARPPAVWLQASTATIYADTRGPAHDETGELGGDEPHVPLSWEHSVRIARRWEQAQACADTPHTRRVALRSALVMSPDRGGIFDVLLVRARVGAGGAVAGSGQYVSWIHDVDFARAVRFLLDHEEVDGPVNLAAPHPLPQARFMRDLRRAWGVPVGLPATAGMARLGAWALGSDPELLGKSRRVVPGRLAAAGFGFDRPWWPGAAADLVRRARERPEGTGIAASVRAFVAA